MRKTIGIALFLGLSIFLFCGCADKEEKAKFFANSRKVTEEEFHQLLKVANRSYDGRAGIVFDEKVLW